MILQDCVVAIALLDQVIWDRAYRCWRGSDESAAVLSSSCSPPCSLKASIAGSQCLVRQDRASRAFRLQCTYSSGLTLLAGASCSGAHIACKHAYALLLRVSGKGHPLHVRETISAWHSLPSLTFT